MFYFCEILYLEHVGSAAKMLAQKAKCKVERSVCAEPLLWHVHFRIGRHRAVQPLCAKPEGV